MPFRYSPAEGSMKPASLLSTPEPRFLFPLLVWTDYGCHLISVMPSREKTTTAPIPHQTSSPFSHQQNQWQFLTASLMGHQRNGPSNWRKLQTNLSNLSIGVKHMFGVLVVYYRLCLNINLPSSSSSIFSWLLLSNRAKTTVAGSTWHKKMKSLVKWPPDAMVIRIRTVFRLVLEKSPVADLFSLQPTLLMLHGSFFVPAVTARWLAL